MLILITKATVSCVIGKSWLVVTDNKYGYSVITKREGVDYMLFSEQISTLRKQANMTQENLAEKCDVSRQAVAKWESGESIPDVYKMSQIANIFDVSLETLVWGDDKSDTEESIAKSIYLLFVDNMESLRTNMLADKYSSSTELATKLRAEIKKARVVFPRKIVDELMSLSDEFGIYLGDITRKPEYREMLKELIPGKPTNRVYCENVLPQKYDRIEELLKDYIDFPE